MLNFIKKLFRKEKGVDGAAVTEMHYTDWSHITTVSFIYLMDSAQSAEELVNLLSHLDKSGINYRGLVVEGEKGIFSKHKISNHNVSFLEKADINWLGIPKNSVINEFTGRKPDIFICFNGANNYTLNYICRLENSGFKVALGNRFDNSLFTLVLQQPDNTKYSAVEMFKRLQDYLKVITSAS